MGLGYARSDLAGVVLAAGDGRRLRPLTVLRPKALCPVGGIPLLDGAVDRAQTVAVDVAVNVHFGRAQMEDHLSGRDDLQLSVEEPVALGTAGALGQLRPWIGDRPTLVLNADAWCDPDLVPFVEGWDGERVRLLLVDDPVFHPRSRIAAALMPWSEVVGLEAEPSGLYERSWRAARADGRLDTAVHRGAFVDCGTPRDYLRANLLAVDATGRGSIVGEGAEVRGDISSSVVGSGAVVDGAVRSSVVWDGCEVSAAEALDHAIRLDGGRTVFVR